jgi:hypothetical protein
MIKMKLRVYETENDGEILKALVNEDIEMLIFNGDYYHDKITERIEGFLYGLEYSGVKYELLATKVIKNKSKMYSICRFDEV